MFTVKIAKLDGTVVWAGFVPEDDVMIYRPPNAPSTAIIQTPMKDALSLLETKVVDEPKPLPEDYWESAQ